MLLSAMQKGHFPFKKATFSYHFKSWGHVPPVPALPTPLCANFSNRHENYYSAWKYTTKEDLEYIQSEGHPVLTNAQPPQTTRASGA